MAGYEGKVWVWVWFRSASPAGRCREKRARLRCLPWFRRRRFHPLVVRSRVARAHLELRVVCASRGETSRGEGEVLGHRAGELDGDDVRVSRVRGGVRPGGRGSCVARVPPRVARGVARRRRRRGPRSGAGVGGERLGERDRLGGERVRLAVVRVVHRVARVEGAVAFARPRLVRGARHGDAARARVSRGTRGARAREGRRGGEVRDGRRERAHDAGGVRRRAARSARERQAS